MNHFFRYSVFSTSRFLNFGQKTAHAWKIFYQKPTIMLTTPLRCKYHDESRPNPTTTTMMNQTTIIDFLFCFHIFLNFWQNLSLLPQYFVLLILTVWSRCTRMIKWASQSNFTPTTTPKPRTTWRECKLSLLGKITLPFVTWPWPRPMLNWTFLRPDGWHSYSTQMIYFVQSWPYL